MDLCLTGRMMDAAEAERAGLVSRIVPGRQADGRGARGRRADRRAVSPVAMMVKESVNRAFETTLAEGVRFERRLFHSTFAHRGPEGGHGGLHRKAKAELPAEPLKAVMRQGCRLTLRAAADRSAPSFTPTGANGQYHKSAENASARPKSAPPINRARSPRRTFVKKVESGDRAAATRKRPQPRCERRSRSCTARSSKGVMHRNTGSSQIVAVGGPINAL